MLWDKKIDHFENENQGGAFGVNLNRNFSLVHFLLIHDKVSSMLVNDLQKHDQNGGDFHEKFWLDLFLNFDQESGKYLSYVLILCIVFSSFELDQNSVKQIWLWLLKVLEDQWPLSNVVLWDLIIGLNGDKEVA